MTENVANQSRCPNPCVLKGLRYNISTNEYPEQFDQPELETYFDHQYLKNDPSIVTPHGIELDLAINTAQVARTFQDRSHNFILIPREMHSIPDEYDIENIQVL